MKFQQIVSTAIVLLALALTGINSALAVTITAVGSQLGLSDFRTTNVAKTLDADGDNVYGTDGYLFFNVNEGGNSQTFFHEAIQSNPGYVSGFAPGTGGPGSPTRNSSGNSNFTLIDDPTPPPSTSVANIRSGAALISVSPAGSQPGVEYELLQITLQDAIPSSGFRLGVLADNLNPNNVPSGIRVSGPGGGNSGLVSLTANNNANNDWYFFDIRGGANGDVISLHLTRNSLGLTVSHGLGGVVFDSLRVVPVPEPSSAVLLGLGTMLLMFRKRRGR